MWILILTLQFFVYMAQWQVRYPNTLQFLLYELKKVALGEFMDDLDIGGEVMNSIGIQVNKGSAADEKVGEERLGSSNLWASLGPTLILGSFVFLIIVLIIVASIVVSR